MTENQPNKNVYKWAHKYAYVVRKQAVYDAGLVCLQRQHLVQHVSDNYILA